MVATGRRQDRLEKLAAELGSAVLPFRLDVTDAAAVAALPGSLPAGWQAVDALINNAGLALGLDPAQSADVADWDRMVATNVTGVIHVTRALLPGMVARKHGHVVNLGSIAATYPYPGGHVYGASKAFVKQFTLNLKADLVGTRVRVTDIEPGLCGGTEFRWRYRSRSRGISRHNAADGRGYRRSDRLGAAFAGTCEYQSDRNDADLPGQRPADRQTSVRLKDSHEIQGTRQAGATLPGDGWRWLQIKELRARRSGRPRC